MSDADNEQTKLDAPQEAPEVKAVEPEVKAVEPEVAAVEPEVAAVEPEVAAVEPEVAAVEPEVAAVEQHEGLREIARGARGRAIRHNWPFAVLGVTTLVLAVGLFAAISGAKDSSPPQGDKPSGSPVAQGPMETFTDPEGGFTLRYPRAWRTIPVPPQGSDLRLVLSTGMPNPGAPGSPAPAGDDGMWVRVVPPNQVEQKYTDFDTEIKSITGDKPCGTEGSACLRQEPVSVAGLNGLRFIYTSPDGITAQNSIHVQYFLRRNQQGNLYVIVFQAVPTTDLSGLAPAFDEVLASFQAA